MTAVGACGCDFLDDGLKMMALVLGLCVIYLLFLVLLPVKNKLVSALLHILLFSFFGLVSFCFILGKTVSMKIRWTMVAGAVIAVVLYLIIFAPIIRTLTAPITLLYRFLSRTARKAAGYLQKRYQMLYNRGIDKYTSRIKKRREKNGDNDKKNQTKEPIKVYTQT